VIIPLLGLAGAFGLLLALGPRAGGLTLRPGRNYFIRVRAQIPPLDAESVAGALLGDALPEFTVVGAQADGGIITSAIDVESTFILEILWRGEPRTLRAGDTLMTLAGTRFVLTMHPQKERK
jgi:hypothetical protein